MSKNVVFWVSIKSPEFSVKYGGYDWMDISKKSWQYWCNKHDCVFYHYDTPTDTDIVKHRVTWQRWFDVFDRLDSEKINYDKVYMVDANTIVHWDCPNFFELVDNRWTCWRDLDNLRWIYDSVIGYKKYFNNFKFDVSEYRNTGCVIINKEHKQFLQLVKDFYYDNFEQLNEAQESTVKKGTDQTPMNYLLQMNKIDTNMELPISYKLTHLHRKEMFSYNWQLQEDQTPFFIKYGYIWFFNGMAKNLRTELMTKTWDLIKGNYE